MYLAESPAAVVVEVLVHLELEDGRLPPSYQLLKIEAPDSIPFESITASDLEEDWIRRMGVTQTIGDKWLFASRTALLSVPSAVLPETSNWLLNPLHPDASQARIVWSKSFPFDGRLFRPRK